MKFPNLIKSSERTPSWTAVPAARSSAAVLQLRLWAVLGTLVVASLFGLFGGIAWLTNQPEPPPEPTPVPESVGFATDIANAWITGRTTALPVGEGIDPSFGRGAGTDQPTPLTDATLAWDRFEVREPLSGRPLEIHYFTISGNPPRELAVTIELTDSGPVLAAAPSLSPMVLAAPGRTRLDYTDQDSAVQWNDAVTRVAGSWAEAFAADDRVRLLELTGDLEDRVYPGLGGLTAANTEVLGAIQVPGEERWIVRIQATFASENGWKATSEWDLLVADPQTASPKVLAWGAGGSGAYLEPYGNGVTGTIVTTTTIAEDRPAAPEN
jgi:hypothetical protein